MSHSACPTRFYIANSLNGMVELMHMDLSVLLNQCKYKGGSWDIQQVVDGIRTHLCTTIVEPKAPEPYKIYHKNHNTNILRQYHRLLYLGVNDRGTHSFMPIAEGEKLISTNWGITVKNWQDIITGEGEEYNPSEVG